MGIRQVVFPPMLLLLLDTGNLLDLPETKGSANQTKQSFVLLRHAAALLYRSLRPVEAQQLWFIHTHIC
jgi:hypothetical protein